MADGGDITTIRDIDVPFWRIVMILVKWSIASIPAMIILMILASLIAAVVGLILAAIGVHVPTTTPTP
jgi:ABC-type polysaccharide/polyol phosphate export permease